MSQILQFYFFDGSPKLTLPEILPPSVIPFWKPPMTPKLNPKSDAKILQIFLQPIFANLLNYQFKRSYHQVLYLFGNLS